MSYNDIDPANADDIVNSSAVVPHSVGFGGFTQQMREAHLRSIVRACLLGLTRARTPTPDPPVSAQTQADGLRTDVVFDEKVEGGHFGFQVVREVGTQRHVLASASGELSRGSRAAATLPTAALRALETPLAVHGRSPSDENVFIQYTASKLVPGTSTAWVSSASVGMSPAAL